MTSRHHRPTRAVALTSVPSLLLDRVRTEGITPSAQSAPTPDGRPPRPHCPRCRGRDNVSHWRFWKEHNEYIWHCSNFRETDRNIGPQLCGFMWREQMRAAPCDVCKLPLIIEQHCGTLGYYCSFCKDFSQ